MKYYAHTSDCACAKGAPCIHWQSLAEHLLNVANLAARFAKPCGLEAEAFLAGLLHDLGKYAGRFQMRLRDNSIHGINHWAAGAGHAYALKAPLSAYAVDGHHTGMPDRSALRQTLLKLADSGLHREINGYTEALDDLLERFAADGLFLSSSPVPPGKDHFANALRARMLLSCLVDADRLDTEAHFDPETAKQRIASSLDADRALGAVLEYVNQKPSHGALNQLRRQLLVDCLSAAEKAPGLFTLTAPTGSGKTLASIAFALRHIAKNNALLADDDSRRLRRVIVVIPFTSIIEQTARVYRELFAPIFGTEFVLEHHSAVAPLGRMEDNERDAEDARLRQAQMAAENWDSPLVVTTSVQFFESLFAHKPRDCRKLHNIARSVVLFDEVQTLPSRLVPSLLSAVRLLSQEPYGSTAVFMTATQPAFAAAKSALPYGWEPDEISSQPEAMAEAMRRTEIRISASDQRISWAEMAQRITAEPQALCVVNSTKDARTLFRLLPPVARFHLSSRLCPAHRQEKLGAIRSLLETGEPCRLISTQLIEAGVDVDFPIAFRALGPLDSIIQTAGRCNREGRNPDPCPVIVFRPEEGGTPPGAYRAATEKTHEFLVRHPGAPLHLPETYRKYFAELYELLGPNSPKDDPVYTASAEFDFPKADEKCSLVGDDTRSVLVQWGEGEALIEKLRREKHLSKPEWRTVQRYSVSLRMGEFKDAQARGYIAEAVEDVWFWNSHYDEDLGACHAEGEDFCL